MWWWMVAAASGQSVTLLEGESVLGACLADEACGTYWTAQVAETLLDVGFAFDHAAIATSALGTKGHGVVAELHVDTMPLGERNELGQQWSPPPAVPRLGASYQMGGRSYDDPRPQLAAGVHLLPPLRLGDGSVVSAGGSASAAWPVHRALWIGGELDSTWSRVTVPLLQSSNVLKDLGDLDAFLGKKVTCDDGCTDRITQVASGARAGVSVEPIPELFAYVRGGATLAISTLELDLDATRWRMSAWVPTFGTGLGVRLGDRYQIAGGLSAGLKPRDAATTGRVMTKVLASMSFRFGPVRTWDVDPARP